MALVEELRAKGLIASEVRLAIVADFLLSHEFYELDELRGKRQRKHDSGHCLLVVSVAGSIPISRLKGAEVLLEEEVSVLQEVSAGSLICAGCRL